VNTVAAIRTAPGSENDLLVQKQVVGEDGAWADTGDPVRVPRGHPVCEVVHRGERLVITEVSRGGT
jgi:hypothetical protein